MPDASPVSLTGPAVTGRHPLNTAPCGCDGTGQVHHGHGALSYVMPCRDRDCGLRNDALFMGVDPEVLDAWWPR